MNSKHHYNNNTELFADQVIAQYDPDLILAVDDNAQRFLAKKHLDTGINIVFSGVNGKVDKYNYIGKKNVTGIFERKSILGILFVLNALNEHNHTEDKKNITLLLDSSNSGKQDKNYLMQQDWEGFNFNAHQVKTFAQWKEFIHSLAHTEIDYVLVSGYRKLQAINDAKQYVDYKTVVEWTQAHSSVPIIALNIFSAQDGFALAVGSSPFEQAHVALEIIDKIFIEKITPKDIAFVIPRLYNIGINKTALKKAKYKIPVFIKSFAEAAHNIYE
ncbi:ABC-type sugar transport system, ATPase component [uncultured Candidatus Thioglobus sp.]|nr:ABC-type sugar transport system, ATPase component [uncultured Candidatus Thioglobus sp.]